MMKKGLVLEGGAMRGLFTAGIIDVMMEAGLEPDGLIGVSAGAAFGCNYKSRQPGRVIRYNTRFAHDKRFCSWQSWWKTGDLYNAQFGYHRIPTELDVFDDVTFNVSPMAFYVVCTDVLTGKAIYKRLDKSNHLTYDWIRASASMPLASKVVELEGQKVLDGGPKKSATDGINNSHFVVNKNKSRHCVFNTGSCLYSLQRNLTPFLINKYLRRKAQVSVICLT